jgi:rod shape-determining protein MreC
MRFIYTKAFAIFSVCVAVVAIVTFLQVKGYGGPIQSVFINAPRPVAAIVSSVARPAKSFFSTIYNLKKITAQNVQLTAQVYQLQQQLAGYNQATRENQDLKQELGFVADAKNQFTPCTALAQNPLGLTDTLIINCGQDSGVSAGQGVVSQGYLIGKIIYAGKTSSTALLITSSQFSSDARVSATGDTGVAEGSFGSGIILDQLPQSSVLNKGDLVVTAGINPQIPQNLLIGQVGSVLSASGDLFKRATLISPINFSNLQFVFVAQ